MTDYTLTDVLGREKVRELAEAAMWVSLYGVRVGRMSPDERLAVIGWMWQEMEEVEALTSLLESERMT